MTEPELSQETKEAIAGQLGGEMERTLEESWETFWGKLLIEIRAREDCPSAENLAMMQKWMRGAYLEGFYDGGLAALSHATRLREIFTAGG